ncbi:NAD(P)-dependent oxidoreductase [Arcicella sp. LKC2W]|uniref:NAD-dependent epimerase/dehydratase family protein n=1 Tax=Arcicella sp. LKC2W TaxID=2984198 RepID=UPI002B1EA4AC|nr:NAD(P)-dependent oxidoreductase [Arcicella sp. LKC2W]MEA5461274.1 NAD(P)-dependent oxidoreductase [Arcicella sp. LKC2W]
MKIFITGGSGFIGTHLIQLLDLMGLYEIINYDLKDPKIISNAIYIKGDIRNESQVFNAMRNCDVIIHLAAIWDDFSLDESEYFSTNVDGTQSVINGAKRHHIHTFINYSSVSVYGETEEECIEKMTNLKPTNPYGKSKLMAEKLFENWYKENLNISVVHLRPSVVFGKYNYGNIYRLINQINSGFYFNIQKSKSSLKSITYVENLTNATVFLLGKIKKGIEIYNYSDTPHMNTMQISNIIEKRFGKKAGLAVPYTFAFALAIPFDLISNLTGKNIPISTMRVKKYCTQTLNNSDKIKLLGYKSVFSSIEGLEKTVDWYKTNRGSN